jgi:hypothetical protein
MDPITVLTAIGTVLKIVDGIEKQVDHFFAKRPESSTEEPHKVLATQESSGTIVVKEKGHVIDTITAQDIENLDENSRKLIKALEESMQQNFNLWTKVYPQRDVSPDPLRNAQVETQLAGIAKKMGDDLDKIFRYLDQIGKHLEDHYGHIRAILRETGGT